MGDEITKYMRVEFERSKVKSTGEVISILNDAGLADDYANAITLYNTSGIIPKDLLFAIGEVLDVEYLLYVKLLADSDVDFVSYGMYGASKIEIYELYAQSQVWSTKLGDVVWEGKGGYAVYKNEGVDLVQKTAEGISKVIGNEKDDGPCENPKEITESVKKASTNTIWATTGITTLLLIILLAVI